MEGSSRRLIGRRHEWDRLTAVVDAANAGRSGSIVVRSGPGLGKTFLLAALTEAYAEQLQVVTLAGVEAEMALDFAGLQRMCLQLALTFDGLPDIQRRAMRAVTGEDPGPMPDPHLAGLAMVNLLSDIGDHRPLICVIDDAQWIDTASRQALGFVARRLLADRVALIFATRAAGGTDDLDAIPEMRLGPLSDAESRALLSTVLPGRLDQQVRERLLADAAGNPLALSELFRALSPAELAGGFGLARYSSRREPATSVEEVFARRYAELPEPSRILLLLAAADPAGDSAALWTAAEHLRLDVGDAAPAETAGLITVDSRIRFRHPLVRTAILQTAPAAQRHRVHAALADSITGPDADDYRAWHRAHATSGPSEPMAQVLTESAHRARERGGITAAAAFLEYATELTPDPVTRARRALEAAGAKLDAGDTSVATRLIETADAVLVDDAHHAWVQLLRARLAFASDRGPDGPRLLLAAAQGLASHAPLISREIYLEALMAAMIVGRLAGDTEYEPEQVAAVAEDAPPPPDPPRAVDMLLDGLVVRLRHGYSPAAPMLTNALRAYLDEMAAGTADPRWHDITNRVCLDLYDFVAYRKLATRQLALLRDAGELTVLPAALATMAATHVISGEFAAAEALLDEATIVSAATNAPPHRSGTALLAAHRGDESLWSAMAKITTTEASQRGEGTELTVTWLSQAMLNNGMSRYVEALDACRSAHDFDDVGLYGLLLVEMVEAASGAREFAIARDIARELNTRAAAAATDSAVGLAARATALAKGEDATDNDYRKALSHLERSPMAVYRARTHLVYGEWLRRAAHHEEARTQLRLAHDLCTAIGADGFAARAVRELAAAGGVPASRGQRYDTGLTTQERHISRLVRQGHTNAEIGEQLLISHRTVEWHLRNIYNKLGITSRRQLRTMADA